MTCLKGFTVAFDLDGTLIDTAPDLAAAMNHVLRSEGLDPLDVGIVRQLIGRGALALIAKGFGVAGRALVQADAERLSADFVSFYYDNIAVHSRPFNGVIEAIEELLTDEAILVICTNKPQGPSEKLLEALGLDHHFSAIVGADAVRACKPDPEHVREAIARGRGDLNRAAFVGDSETDERAARGSGLPFLLYPHGYRSASVAGLAADAVFDNHRALPDLIRNLGG